jgi:serine O-acetyltransferase
MKLQFAEEILRNRHSQKSILPPKEKAYQFVNDLLELLFPQFCGEFQYFEPEQIAGKMSLIERDLRTTLKHQQESFSEKIETITGKFFEKLPEIYHKLWLDAKAIHEGDPASESIDEVIAAYPGFFAIYSYRIAHEFYTQGVPIFPRILSEYAHFRTGIDIHPGARIGDSFFVDHGTGIVVGETTDIGKNVKLYQGVTLGALSVDKKYQHTKRHPTIEDNVIIYSSATILGGTTTVGHHTIIGGNVWLTESVPAYSIVYQKNEIRVRQKQDDSVINFSI